MNKTKYLLLASSLLGMVAISGCKFEFRYSTTPYPFDDVLPDDDDDGGSYEVKVWCDTSILTLTKTQLASFEAVNNGKYKLTFNVEPMSEGEAASKMIQDVQLGADVFCFAQDQLASLKIAGALGDITGNMALGVKSDNPKGAVNAATYGDTLCAFPMTSDNGYYMYYDKQILSDTDVKDMSTVIQKVKAVNKRINYPVFSNAFYSASYFMATGCYSKWTVNPKTGNFVSYEDNYKEKGLKALKALRELKAADLVAPNDQTNKLGDTAAVAISGIWNYKAAEKALGNNLGCCEMPSFTVDGETFHISSFSGYKLIGVKPQTDGKKASVCRKIARYLTNQECQLQRFNEVGWGPSNLLASQDEKVLAQPGLKALAEQLPYSQEQGLMPSSWWSNCATLASSVKGDSSDAQLEEALSIYTSNLDELLGD
ncbi:MAG: extracellular solute-binding protein [Bacilli bacterium]|nr:extracellular solute-binding protein [Bacilli bacterium]